MGFPASAAPRVFPGAFRFSGRVGYRPYHPGALIPLRDTIPTRTVPLVNGALIAACIGVFVVQLLAGSGGETLVRAFGFVPARLFHAGRAGAGEPAAGRLRPLQLDVPPRRAFSTSRGTCSSSGSSGTTSRTRSATAATSSSTSGAASWRPCSRASSPRRPSSRWSALRGRSPASSAPTSFSTRTRGSSRSCPLFFLFPLVEVPAFLFLLLWFLLQFWQGSAALVASGKAGAAAGGRRLVGPRRRLRGGHRPARPPEAPAAPGAEVLDPVSAAGGDRPPLRGRRARRLVAAARSSSSSGFHLVPALVAGLLVHTLLHRSARPLRRPAPLARRGEVDRGGRGGARRRGR